jgi:hypothetical protein
MFMAPNTCKKQSLSGPRRQLVELLQDVNFGKLENLLVRAGEPQFAPAPRVIRELKFGGDNGSRDELAAPDFLLKAQVVELFNYLDQLQNGVVNVLEIKHGLPFRLIIEDAD